MVDLIAGEKLCPSCLTRFEWAKAERFVLHGATYEPYQETVGSSAEKLDFDSHLQYRRCPGDAPEHYLHEDYGRSDKLLVIGLVGGSDAGKSVLLASMVGEIHKGVWGQRLAEQTYPVDFVQYGRYLRESPERLRRGEALPGTRSDDLVLPPVALMFRPNDRAQPPTAVVFFDVEGEKLADVTNGAVRYLQTVDGLLFVVDLEKVPRNGRTKASGDRTFDFVRDFQQRRYSDLPGPIPVPAAIVLAKSDLRRYEYPVDDWMSRGWLGGENEDVVDGPTIRAESQDAYAFLHANGGESFLAPCAAFSRVTLHFASATGKAATVVSAPRTPPGAAGGMAAPQKTFGDGVRPQRVLGPLAALLAMLGALPNRTNGEVGI